MKAWDYARTIFESEKLRIAYIKAPGGGGGGGGEAEAEAEAEARRRRLAAAAPARAGGRRRAGGGGGRAAGPSGDFRDFQNFFLVLILLFGFRPQSQFQPLP